MTQPESTLEELFASGATSEDYTEALGEFRLRWPLLTAEQGDEVRALLDGIPAERWHDDPWLIAGYGSSYRSLTSNSRSAALPYFEAARAIVTDDTALATRIGILLHHCAALRSLGALDDAATTAREAIALLAPDTSMPLAWRIQFTAKLALQLGIVLYHLGDYDGAQHELSHAEGLERNLLKAERVECHAALAMLQYSMGNFDRSGDQTALAREAAGDSGLLESMFGTAALIAELLIDVEQSRVDDAERLCATVAEASAGSDWEPLGTYACAAISIITERHVEGLDLLRRCLQSYRGWHPHGAIVTMSEGLRATLLLRLGETDTAWDILGSLAPTQHHANCPGRFIAHLRFVNGDAAGTLAALRECDVLGDSHSSRTLVDVQLLRAAANYALGNARIADVALDRALLLAASNDMRIPFRLIPDEVMRTMLARAASRSQPADVHALFDQVQGSPDVAAGAVLSERERDIVRSLMRGAGAAEMADELFISVNTVKSHLKNIYRKLGVSKRKDAVKRARELGLQLDITLD